MRAGVTHKKVWRRLFLTERSSHRACSLPDLAAGPSFIKLKLTSVRAATVAIFRNSWVADDRRIALLRPKTHGIENRRRFSDRVSCLNSSDFRLRESSPIRTFYSEVDFRKYVIDRNSCDWLKFTFSFGLFVNSAELLWIINYLLFSVCSVIMNLTDNNESASIFDRENLRRFSTSCVFSLTEPRVGMRERRKRRPNLMAVWQFQSKVVRMVQQHFLVWIYLDT